MLIYDLNANPLNSNEWAFPLTECFHVLSMALCIGSIVVVDLRLLGAGIRSRTAAELVRETELWTVAGFSIVIASGLLIFSSDPIKYLHSAPFRLKMALLLLGIVYNYTLHRKVAQATPPSRLRWAVAAVSLALWGALVFSAIFVAFW
jgi:hypothetical protein